MTAYLLANHIFNFLAPSLFLALGLASAGRLMPAGRRPGAPSWQRQFGVLLLVNLSVSTAALLWLGQDGKFLAYSALVAAAALAQWWLLRGWKA